MALRLEYLKKQYIGPDGSIVPVIDIESLSIGDGEQIALIGTSGSGKTTLLHMIAGIVAPDSGEIVYDWRETPRRPERPGFFRRHWPHIVTLGTPLLFYKLLQWEERLSGGQQVHQPVSSSKRIDITNLSEPQRDVFRGSHIGYIFQTHHLLGGFSALENVLLGMSFTGRKPDRAWAIHLLTEVGLKDRLDYRPAKLSVGQQQRVAVARALANRPKLVLADEPTGALDPANGLQVLGLIRNLCSEVGASLLLVTHDLDIAHQFPRILTLSEINRASSAAKAAVAASVA